MTTTSLANPEKPLLLRLACASAILLLAGTLMLLALGFVGAMAWIVWNALHGATSAWTHYGLSLPPGWAVWEMIKVLAVMVGVLLALAVMGAFFQLACFGVPRR